MGVAVNRPNPKIQQSIDSCPEEASRQNPRLNGASGFRILENRTESNLTSFLTFEVSSPRKFSEFAAHTSPI